MRQMAGQLFKTSLELDINCFIFLQMNQENFVGLSEIRQMAKIGKEMAKI
jgi:hypothetical protein